MLQFLRRRWLKLVEKLEKGYQHAIRRHPRCDLRPRPAVAFGPSSFVLRPFAWASAPDVYYIALCEHFYWYLCACFLRRHYFFP